MNWPNTRIYDEKDNNFESNNNFGIIKTNKWPSEEQENDLKDRLEQETIQEWEQMHQVQNLKDQLNEIDEEKWESIDSYKEYTKIVNCKNDLQKIFTKGIPKDQFIVESAGIIMSMLTDRESYSQMLKNNWWDLIKLKNVYKTQNDRYNKTLELTQKVIKENEMDRESNPAWYWISTTPEIQKEWLNYKHYTTIPIQNYNYITEIPKLAYKLRKLWLENDDAISIKVPNNFIGFLKHNDSIVVHFKNQENSEKITNIISERSNTNNIPLWNRELWRTALAADWKDNNWKKSSFSELVSKNIASWMYDMRQTRKYTENIIIEQWILHAIAQSSKAPTVWSRDMNS